jgi:UDP-N-acetylglucosamine acyltransferase
MLGGHVVVDDGVFLGGSTAVHQFVRIGKLAISQGNSSLSKDLPPFLMASELNSVVGLNVVGLKRAGFSLEQRSEVKEAFSWVYRRGYNLAQAIQLARGRKWGLEADCFWQFLELTGKRGVCGWRGRHARRSERQDRESTAETEHQPS